MSSILKSTEVDVMKSAVRRLHATSPILVVRLQISMTSVSIRLYEGIALTTGNVRKKKSKK